MECVMYVNVSKKKPTHFFLASETFTFKDIVKFYGYPMSDHNYIQIYNNNKTLHNKILTNLARYIFYYWKNIPDPDKSL